MRATIAILLAYSVYITVCLFMTEPQVPPDRVCITLYNETGLECCK